MKILIIRIQRLFGNNLVAAFKKLNKIFGLDIDSLKEVILQKKF
jgi:hypothetical protein